MPTPAPHTDPTLQTWRPSGVLPRSVYIHIPFCRHRCGYCNFTLVAGRDYLVDRFLDALETEISWLDQRYEVESLFLGGGTPSHLSPSNLKRLKKIVSSRFDLTSSTEVTAECNPNDMTADQCNALAEFGVNRISLGVQSLNAAKLSRLERDHVRDDVENAVRLARSFARSISVDLIFAAPGESLNEWRQDLESVLQLNPDHVSTYELTYEKGTQFWNRRVGGELAESEEDLRADMYEFATDRLDRAGLAPYEVSSFAKPDHRCFHNESYWTGRPYFAFGPGASRYVDRVRQTNHQSTMQYLKRLEAGKSPVSLSEKLAPLDSANELLAIGLRRVDGVNENAFESLTEFRVAELLANHAGAWQLAGLLIQEGPNWRLSFRGRMLCDRLAAEIVG